MLLRFFVLGAGLAYGISVASNRPPMSTRSDGALAVLLLLLLWLAYSAGRRFSASATATAVASAISRSLAASFAASRSDASVVLNFPASAPRDGSDHDAIGLWEAYEDSPAPRASAGDESNLFMLSEDPAAAAEVLYEATGQRFAPDLAAQIVAELGDDERSHLLGARDHAR